MAKVLVTGANGFLGSWLVKALLNEKLEVFALVRKSSDLSELRDVACHYVYGDVTDLASLLESFKGIDAVFHLAGLIAYKNSERKKMELINVEGTRNVIQACIQSQVKRLIHLSSVVAIGASFDHHHILNENSVYNLSHLNLGYFETKRQAERLVLEAVQKNKLDAVILNPSTIYGAGDAKKGSRSTQLKVAQARFPFYTSGGVNVVAVEDVVAGIISAWKIGKTGERYILCGENFLIKDLFKLIAQAAGVPPPKIKIPDLLLHLLGIIGDLFNKLGFRFPVSRENAWTATLYHWFDSAKAQQELGFKPGSSREALKRSVRWMKDHELL